MEISGNLLLPLLTCIVVMYVALQFGEDEEIEPNSLAYRTKRGQERHVLLKIFGPIIVILGQLISLIPLGQRRALADKRLAQAGRPGGLSVDEYYGLKLLAVFIAAMAGLLFDTELDLTPILTLAFAALGYVYPDIWITGVIEKRRRRIFRDLPDILDTLRLAVDAGLDLGSALRVVAEEGRKGPLLEEFAEVEREVSLGRTRAEAFRNLADRLVMTEINSFVLALNQADQLGASIGPVLKVQAEMARNRRWQMAEVIVNKMPMKMLGPLIMFIFPASFIILFTPLIIQWMQN